MNARDLGFQSSGGKKEAKTGAFKPTLLTSRIERPTADPKEGIAIIYYTRETNFRRPPLAELDVGAASFAVNTEGCREGVGVGRSRGRGWSGGAREQPVFKNYTKTDSAVKIQSDVTTALTY